jgi:hypothetical protein
MVQLGEKQDAASAREKLIHDTAEMIATKLKAKMYHKNCHTFLFNICHGLKDTKKIIF